MARTPRFLVALALLAPAASSQVLERAVPAAGGPDDLVVIRGTDLAGVTAVRFTGNVGGFTGLLSVDVVPESATATELRVRVPQINAFVGPAAVPPSNAFGWISLPPSGPFGPDEPLAFFFFEEPTAALEAVGDGTTHSTGIGASVTTFDIAAGPPKLPNPILPPPGPVVFTSNANFTLRVENALPAVPALLLIGAPASEPYLPIADGDLVVDLAGAWGFFAGVTDARGDLSVPLPIPDGPSGDVMFQFVTFDPGVPGQLATARGLRATL